MAEFDDTEINKLLNSFGKRMVKLTRANLTRAGKKASGTLWKSISYEVHDGRLNMFMECYGQFVDKGVKGIGRRGRFNYESQSRAKVARSLAGYKFTKGPGGPEVERSFRSWIADRNIAFRDKLGRILPRRTATFLLMRHTGRFGIQPTAFYTKALDTLLPRFEKELGEAVDQAVGESVDDIFQNTFSSCKLK